MPGSAQASAPGVGGTCMHPHAGHPKHRLALGIPAPHVVRVSHASDEQRPPETGLCLPGAAEKTLLCPSITSTHFYTILLCTVLEGMGGHWARSHHIHHHLLYLHKGRGSCPKCVGARQTWEHPNPDVRLLMCRHHCHMRAACTHPSPISPIISHL